MSREFLLHALRIPATSAHSPQLSAPDALRKVLASVAERP